MVKLLPTDTVHGALIVTGAVKFKGLPVRGQTTMREPLASAEVGNTSNMQLSPACMLPDTVQLPAPIPMGKDDGMVQSSTHASADMLPTNGL